MKTIIENVIKNGRYELADICKKIDKVWLEGGVTDEERDKLTELARDNTTPEMGYPSIEERLESIEERLTALENSSESTGNEEFSDEEYPVYKQPTGAHNAYYTGDKISYAGKKYVCIAPAGYGVSYAPDMLPIMWEEVYA